MNSDDIIIKHLFDLSQRAYEKNFNTFSEFINMNEISLLKGLKTPCNYTLFGGYELSERCVAGFGENIDLTEFPIVCIKSSPLQKKFSDKLTHRDFLGSLMQLGINRNTLGDIIVKDNTAYIFALEKMGEYICDNLSRVKHTSVNCEILSDVPTFINEKSESEEIIVPSLRADAVISAVYKLSRNQAKALFSGGKVFINSKECFKESTVLNENDIISVRGSGKFIFGGEIRRTKKDRIVISVSVYR